MSVIAKRLTTVPYKRGYKYQLVEDVEFFVEALIGYEFTLPFITVKDGYVTAHAGYAWDGASGPTIDTNSSMAASLIHDILYQAMRNGKIDSTFQEVADHVLEVIAIGDNMFSWRAKAWRKVLGWFGKKNTLPSAKRKIYYAP